MNSVANNVYGWYPSKKDGKLIFEFFNSEFEIDERDLEDTNMVEDAKEIQDLVFNFEQNYINKK